MRRSIMLKVWLKRLQFSHFSIKHDAELNLWHENWWVICIPLMNARLLILIVPPGLYKNNWSKKQNWQTGSCFCPYFQKSSYFSFRAHFFSPPAYSHPGLQLYAWHWESNDLVWIHKLPRVEPEMESPLSRVIQLNAVWTKLLRGTLQQFDPGAFRIPPRTGL